MADAKKCDRCGEFYDERSILCKRDGDDTIWSLKGSLRVYEDYANRGIYYDLCPVCFKNLTDFLHIKETTPMHEKLCVNCEHCRVDDQHWYCENHSIVMEPDGMGCASYESKRGEDK